jgi:hypothetical protein
VKTIIRWFKIFSYRRRRIFIIPDEIKIAEVKATDSSLSIIPRFLSGRTYHKID